MEDFTKEQEEFRKCHDSFSHFAKNWLKIYHPRRGMVSLEMYPFQERLIHDYEQHRFNILTKFRQGGFTTVTAAWALWHCIFKLDQRIMWIAPRDKDAIGVNNMLRDIIKNLPEWMMPKLSKCNDHRIVFEETNGTMYFGAPEATRGISMSKLIIDEPGYIKQMDKYWKAMYPVLSCGGECIAVGTPNKANGWFFETYQAALVGKNAWHVYKADYYEHPDYNNADWVAIQKEQLGQQGWAQEVLQSFTSSLEPDDGKC